MTKEKFIVADYYENFKCKCGDCRNCCCEGWGVTLSYAEYTRLLGLVCHKSLRAKLDRSFYILPDATAERYAALNRTYTGSCPLRDDDGKCFLQKSKGEGILPEICKIYPRNVMERGVREGACANSCEETLSLMFATNSPLVFSEKEINVDADDSNYTVTSSEFAKIQSDAIKILQNRRLTLSNRLYELCLFASKLKNTNIDEADCEAETSFPVNTGATIDTLRAVADIVGFLCTYSPSFSKNGTQALDAIGFSHDGNINEIYNAYRANENKLYETLPNMDIYLEDVIVNHLFFTRFPSCDVGQTAYDKCISAAGIAAVLKFTVSSLADKIKSVEDFIDVTALSFRCFEHSAAPDIVRRALSEYGLDTPDAAAMLTSV